MTSAGAVVAPSREAIEVGQGLLAGGGNAIDAAIGAAFAQFVVEPFMTGPGAVGELVYLEPSGESHVVDAAARAPLRADATMFDVVGEPAGIYLWPEVAGGANTVGPLAATAPRLVAGLHAAHAQFGRLSWADVVGPAARLAAEGWDVDFLTSAYIVTAGATLAQDDLAQELLFEDGIPLPPPVSGEPRRLTNRRLAHALEEIRKSGADALRSGPLANAILDAAGPPRGVLRADDLAEARATVVSSPEPLMRYRDWAVYGSCLPSGAVSVAQILALLDAAGPPSPDPLSPERYCRFAVASHLAFADRLGSLAGDESEERVRDLLAEPPRPERVAAVRHGSLGDAVGRGVAQTTVTATTHVSVIDSNGAAAALTHTLLSVFGAHVGVADGGFFLNNGMLWFDPRPGRPNSIRPGARALSAMSPVIAVSPDGCTRLALGALGARRIIPAVAQILQNVIDYDMTLDEAVNWPRIHADTLSVVVDERLSPIVLTALKAAGFHAEPGQYGPTTFTSARAAAVAFDGRTGATEIGIDRRSEACWRFGADDVSRWASAAGGPERTKD